MKLIKPSQISGEIMTLIQEADSKLVIVSPYYKIDTWKKLLNSIKFPKNKQIDIEFYVREGEFQSINQVKSIGFTPIEIKRLHTKLYFNEDYAIVSSMNLVEASDMESLDIAYKTETKEEYNDLLEYYKRYIQNNISKEKSTTPSKSNAKYKVVQGHWLFLLESLLYEKLGKRFNSKFDNNTLILNGPNMYYVHISQNYGKNTLNINGIVSHDEYCELLKSPSIIHKDKTIESYFYKNGGYSFQQNAIWYHSEINLKSNFLPFLYKEDYDNVIDIIFNFILGLQEFKDDFYYKSRPDAKKKLIVVSSF